MIMRIVRIADRKLIGVTKMSRAILFKAKRKDNGEWVEGGYFCEPYTDKEFIIRWNSFGFGCNEFIEIAPDTLC